MTNPEKNKQTVVAYYNLVINDKRPAATTVRQRKRPRSR